MKRTLIPLLLCLCLLLTGCGKSKAETAYESFAERLRQADALSFTALLRAEYERKTARFTLSYAEDETGGRVTVLAPELIQGVSAHVAPGGTTLEYDSVVSAQQRCALHARDSQHAGGDADAPPRHLLPGDGLRHPPQQGHL